MNIVWCLFPLHSDRTRIFSFCLVNQLTLLSFNSPILIHFANRLHQFLVKFAGQQAPLIYFKSQRAYMIGGITCSSSSYFYYIQPFSGEGAACNSIMDNILSKKWS